jgi:hypothetical protein
MSDDVREWELPDGTAVLVRDIPILICAMEEDDMDDDKIAKELGLTIEQLEAVREAETLRFNWFWGSREPYLH